MSIRLDATWDIQIDARARIGERPLWCIAAWIKPGTGAGGNSFQTLYDEFASFPQSMAFRLRGPGAGDDEGKFNLFFRGSTSSIFADVKSANRYDDDRPHSVIIGRFGASDFRLYVDGVQDGSDTTDVTGMSYNTGQIRGGGADNAWRGGSLLGRLVTMSGRSSTAADRMLVAAFAAVKGVRMGGVQYHLWLEGHQTIFPQSQIMQPRGQAAETGTIEDPGIVAERICPPLIGYPARIMPIYIPGVTAVSATVGPAYESLIEVRQTT